VKNQRDKCVSYGGDCVQKQWDKCHLWRGLCEKVGQMCQLRRGLYEKAAGKCVSDGGDCVKKSETNVSVTAGTV
jgi:hypothetical protein